MDKDHQLTYIIKVFKQLTLFVRNTSVVQNITVIKNVVYNRSSLCKTHLVLWMLGPEQLLQAASVLEKLSFDQITCQGDFLLPSH